ncbi:MAG: sodium:proton antiporter [Bacteroidetes bacterium]|nr:MAG: sodium:proton antiporter [Bacteroidota bacterium]
MNHLPSLIQDLALILGSAAVTTLLFKWLKQPLVLGYIIAGILVGPYFHLFPDVVEIESIQIWAEIGVVFLLFGLGLEFSFKKLIKIGSIALVTALCGVLTTLLTGFFVGQLLGWNSMDSLFLGGILSIASTTIIIRAFNELGVKQKKFTNIVMGVLIIEDLVAVVLMVLLSTIAVSREFEGLELAYSMLKLLFFIILWFVSGIFIIPTLLRKFKQLLNEETLLVLSLALCFLLVVLASNAGFSPALGAFVMGSMLAETTKAERIEHGLKSLKNLFGAIFFVSVGMLINPAMLIVHWQPILITTLVLLVGKPLFATMGALFSGQTLSTSIQTGMSLSQIGEFSFIIATLGLSLKVTSEFLYPIAVAVSVITAFTTPYMIRLSEPVHLYMEKVLPEKWRDRLGRYSIGAQDVPDESAWKKLLRQMVLNTSIFSVITFSIIVFCTRYLEELIPSMEGKKLLLAAVSLVLLAPFLWALAFRRNNKEAYAEIWMKPYQRGPLILLQLSRVVIALFFLGILFSRLFTPWHALLGVVVACVILFLFRARIRKFYGKIEERFKSNMNQRATINKGKIPELLPWDAHFASFTMHTHYPFIGKTLAESGLREEFGINIVRIRREEDIIDTPTRYERLFPGDELVVIGTDKQLNRFNYFLEHAEQHFKSPAKEVGLSLQHFKITPNSTLLGQSIRSSKLREKIRGLVVGIDRNEQHILNPESHLIFELDDVVWVVGSERRVQVFIREAQRDKE